MFIDSSNFNSFNNFCMSFKNNISILVDYAHEPESMRQLLESAVSWKDKKEYDYIIHIVSCDGAGRDDWKKPIMGKISYNLADYSVVTLDNYDERDNPEEILALLTKDYDKSIHNDKNQKYFVTPSRQIAFETALEQAKKIIETGLKNQTQIQVLIISTGVGTENGLTQPGGTLDWNEKVKWTELFNQIN
jgi:UDP-N-acetylmuramyl tripeptide synthase